MINKDNQSKILIEFFKYEPTNKEGLQLREIGRKIDLAPTSVKKYLQELEKIGIIIKKLQSGNNYPLYYPNLNNKHYLYIKNVYIIQSIKDLGLLEKLEKEVRPETIVLGGMNFESDVREIKLLIRGKATDMNFEEYEKGMNIKIVPLYSKDFKKLSEELEKELINGVVLKGSLEINRSERKKSEEEPKIMQKSTIINLSQPEESDEEEGFYSKTLITGP